MYILRSYTVTVITSTLTIMWPSYGHITCLAHPSVHPSVRPIQALTQKRRNAEKSKLAHGMSKWSANYQFERSKVKVTGRKNLQNLAPSLLTGGSAGGSSMAGADCTRLMPLLGLLCCWLPETLGNGMDGHVQCRCRHLVLKVHTSETRLFWILHKITILPLFP